MRKTKLEDCPQRVQQAYEGVLKATPWMNKQEALDKAWDIYEEYGRFKEATGLLVPDPNELDS